MFRDVRSRPIRSVVAAAAALLLAFALAACTPPQEFPPGTTDGDLWERNDIRIDTEVPNQYPNGRTRDLPETADAQDHGDEHGGEEATDDDH